MRNRIIAIVLIIALIPCCLAVPASAAGASKDTIINLMSENGDFSSNPVNVLDGGYWVNNSSLVWAKSVIAGDLVWNSPYYDILDAVYFSVEFSDIPKSVAFLNDGKVCSTELLGVVGNTYSYKVIPNTLLGQISLRFEFNSGFTGYVSLVSAYGVKENAYHLTSVHFENQALLFEADEDKLYRYTYEQGHFSLPVKSQHTTNYVSEVVDPLIEGIFFVGITPDNIPFNYADSINFFVVTCGSIKENTVSFSVKDKSGSYLEILPVSITNAAHYKGISGFPDDSNMEWPKWVYSVTVDISGYSFSDYNFTLQYSVDPVWLYEYEGYSGYMSALYDVVLYPTIESQPWYARFGQWITGGFQSVVDAISGLFNPEGSSELSQAGEDLSNSAVDINAAGNALGSVDQPDIDSGALIGGFTNFDTGGLKVLSCITSNEQVTQMMIVVFTFCLAGYIFFGKKG